MFKSLSFLLLLAAPTFADSAALERARQLYERTEYESAVQILAAIPNKQGPAFELLGKCRYMLGDFKKASEAFEKAVEAGPDNSSYHHWLGKAYGRRAENSSFLTAPGYASKARRSFEKAVELDPSNLEAMNDLFEYYLQAPGFLGGGMDKAKALAERIGKLNPAEHRYALARIAEKREDYQAAEGHLRRAAELAPKQVGRLIDLAKFLAKRGRHQESDAVFREAEKIAPGSPKLLFARASTYIRAGRNLDTARELLERYLRASLTPEDPPRREAEQLLRKVANG